MCGTNPTATTGFSLCERGSDPHTPHSPAVLPENLIDRPGSVVRRRLVEQTEADRHRLSRAVDVTERLVQRTLLADLLQVDAPIPFVPT